MLFPLLLAFWVGACAGSFLGVVIHRLPRGISIVTPPSHCSACGTRLAWFENLPILGWLALRGRCRHCGSPIPPACLGLELAVGALTTLVTWAVLTKPYLWCMPLLFAQHTLLATGVALVVLLALVWLLSAAVLIDLEHLIIPDEITKGLQVVAIPLAVLTGANFIWPWIPIVERGLALISGALGSDWSPNMDPHWWFRRWDIMDGWQGTPLTAVKRLGLSVGVGLGLIVALLPLARRIYGKLKHAPWGDEDHRAMRRGAWWFVAWTGLWTLATMGLILSLGAGRLAQEYHPGSILCLALTQAILGALVGWWLPWLVGLVGSAGFRRNAMGYGDVKLFCALGAFLGPIGILAAFMLATLVGTVVGIPARLLGGGREVPFGPSLAAGAVLAIALGPWLAPRVLHSFH